MATKWKPIDTAPTSGEFLVRGGELFSEVGGPYPFKVAHIEAKEGLFDVCNSCGYAAHVYKPTEWAHIPK